MSPTLQGALNDGFGEAVVGWDMPEQCKFPSLDKRQEKFLWTPKGVDLATLPVAGMVLQVADTKKFPHALGFESLDSFFRVSKQGPCCCVAVVVVLLLIQAPIHYQAAS